MRNGKRECSFFIIIIFLIFAIVCTCLKRQGILASLTWKLLKKSNSNIIGNQQRKTGKEPQKSQKPVSLDLLSLLVSLSSSFLKSLSGFLFIYLLSFLSVLYLFEAVKQNHSSDPWWVTPDRVICKHIFVGFRRTSGVVEGHGGFKVIMLAFSFCISFKVVIWLFSWWNKQFTCWVFFCLDVSPLKTWTLSIFVNLSFLAFCVWLLSCKGQWFSVEMFQFLKLKLMWGPHSPPYSFLTLPI